MYVIAIYLFLAGCVLYSLKNPKFLGSKPELIIFFAYLIFFVIRFNLGRDLLSYSSTYYIFKQHPSYVLDKARVRNFAYHYLIYFLVQTIKDYRWVVLLWNVISMSLCGTIIYKYSKNKLFSLMIFTGSGMLEVYYGSGIRQMIAMSILLVGFYEFLPKKKYFWYEVLCLLAVSFHETALPAVLFPLLMPLVNIFKRHVKKVIVIGLAVSLSISLICIKVLPYMFSTSSFPFEYWMLLDYLSAAKPSILGIGQELVLGAGVLFIFYSTDKEKRNDFMIFEVLAFLSSVFIYLCLLGFPTMSRVADCLQIISLIMIPELISCISLPNRKLISVCGVIVLNLFFLVADLHTNLPAIGRDLAREITIVNDPYITVFDKQWIDETFSPADWYIVE